MPNSFWNYLRSRHVSFLNRLSPSAETDIRMMWQKSFHAKTSCGKSNTKNFTVHLHNCSTFSISLRSFAVLHRVHHKEEDDENGSARFVSFFFVLTSNAALSARFHCLASTRIDWKFEIFRKLITFSELIAAYKRIFIICNRR